jgi:acetyltransferase-like isoleucine patch superfamily enzyme
MIAARAWWNRLRRRLVHGVAFRMLFGEQSQGVWLPMTRISPSTLIHPEAGLTLGDHVHIGPFNVIDAGAGVVIEEGVQITSHCAIVTHSSHRAQRLLGRGFVRWPDQRPGWVKGPVHIGAYSFVGPHCVIEANTHLGRGSLVRAGSVVRGRFPDFAVLAGNPATVVGDTREADAQWLAAHPEVAEQVLGLRERWAGVLVPPASKQP